MTIGVIIYEVYLAVTLVSFEPLLFFFGLASYWGLLYHSLTPIQTIPGKLLEPTKKPELTVQIESNNKQIQSTEQIDPIDHNEDHCEIFSTIDDNTEEAMMKDETIMSEWRDLLTRAWKGDEPSSSSSASIFAADNDSVMSRSSRFDEEEDFSPPPNGSISSSDDDEDEDLGFDPHTLEAFLSQYDQIKKDAELAKQLQLEEQKARDENNPFVVENMAIGKSQVDEFDDDKVTTPTDKEAWKIRVFRD